MTLVQTRRRRDDDEVSAASEPAPPSAHGDIAAFESLLEHYEIISFDVFDTLLARRLARPADVFELVGRICGVPSFARIRVTAEQAARLHCHAAGGGYEVTLDDIYLEVERRLPRHAGRLRQEEIAVERRVLYPNPAGVAAFRAVQARGKRVVAVSDMYLPADLVRDVLTANGFPIADVFVSGELKASKADAGKAFSVVAEELRVPPGAILHVGDNTESDFENALRAGCGAWLLVSRNDRLFRDLRVNQAAISGLMAAEWNLAGSFLVAYLADRLETAGVGDAISLFGRMYAAPYLFAFAMWLEEVRRRDGVRRLLLLTRDGYALKPVLQLLGSDAELVLMHSSRRMMYFATLEESFAQTCRELAEGVAGGTPRGFIIGLETADTEGLLAAVGKSVDLDRKVVTQDDVASMTKALINCHTLLLDLARAERAALCGYLDALNPGAGDTAIVDCGWALNTHRRLEKLTGSTIRGYYIGTSGAAPTMHRKIRSFLFSAADRSAWHELHWRSAELLELPFIAEERRAVRMVQGRGQHDVVVAGRNGGAEQVRAAMARTIQREVAAFCKAAEPMRGWFTHEEAATALLTLYSALTRHPTTFEYFAISAIPHGRSIGEHEIQSVGRFWKCGFTQDDATPEHTNRWRRYTGLTLRSLRRDGVRLTLFRIRQRLRMVLKHRFGTNARRRIWA